MQGSAKHTLRCTELSINQSSTDDSRERPECPIAANATGGHGPPAADAAADATG